MTSKKGRKNSLSKFWDNKYDKRWDIGSDKLLDLELKIQDALHELCEEKGMVITPCMFGVTIRHKEFTIRIWEKGAKI